MKSSGLDFHYTPPLLGESNRKVTVHFVDLKLVCDKALNAFENNDAEMGNNFAVG